MSFFTNKKFLFKLIATICIFLTLFNFGLAPKSNAADISAVGGILLDPIVDMALVLGDGIMEIIQRSIMGTPAGLIFSNKGSWLDTLKSVVKVVLAIVIGLVAVAAVAWLAAFIPFIGGIIAAGITSGVVKVGAVFVAYSLLSATVFPDNVVLPTFYISPEEIFKGDILLFDVNIFSPETVMVELIKGEDTKQVTVDEYNELQNNPNNLDGYEFKRYYYENDEGEIITTSINNSAQELKSSISKWYYTIRNIALIGLMLVLIYIGLKMLLTSIASEKAKYKQMLGDWLVAMCLIFVMHYLMVFLNVFVDNVVQMLSSVTETTGTSVVLTEAEKIKSQLEDDGYNSELLQDDNGGTVTWKTNLMGQFRFEAQRKDGTASYVGYTVCYVVIVIYTVIFTFTYLKRLLYILFLTVIAPFVAMTYPIDKIKDGKAQAFEMWMKEYIYNLIIQPFHLLLYVIFISMAFDLAGKNVIYALVVIGFMIPAEKFLRKMFGFDKASSPGFLAGAGGIAMAMTAMKTLGSYANGGKGGNKKPEGGDSKIQQTSNDFLERGSDSGHGLGDLLDGAAQEGQNTNGGSDGGNSPQSQNDLLDDQQRAEQEALTQYNSEGFGQNTDGEYFNPWTEEYDPNYNPMQDENYNSALREQNIEDQSTPQEDSNIEEPNIEEPPQDTGKRMGYLSAAWKNAKGKNSFKKVAGKTFKGGIRSVAKVSMAGAGAALGLAAGIASGSPGDALKYGLGGMYAGSAIGTGTANRGISGVEGAVNSIKKQHEEIQKTQYGSKEYKQMQNAKKDEEFMKDAEMRKLYADRFKLTKKEDIDQVMKDAVEYRKYGVTDNNVIMKAMGFDRNNRTSKESIAAARLSSISKTQKDLDKAMERYAQSGASRQQVEKMRRNIESINF